MNLVKMTGSGLDALVRRRRLLRVAMIVLMAFAVLADVLKPSHYSRFPWDGIPGFTAAFAFAGALALIGIYKAIGYGLVYRRPDYYDGPTGDDAEDTEDG